jgi:hypothetical protein
MSSGKGYIVRGSGTGFNSGNTVNASFSGVPNNGVTLVDIIATNPSDR